MKNYNDNNTDIDTLINEVLQNDEIDKENGYNAPQQANSQFESAKKELFPDKPEKLTLEDIKADPSHFVPFPKKSVKESADASQNVKTEAIVKDTDSNTVEKPHEAVAAYKQQSIDVDANLTKLPSEDALNKVNYKSILSKIIKSGNGVDTKEFKMSLENEDGIIVDESVSEKKATEPIPLISVQDKQKRVFDEVIAVRTFTPKTTIDDAVNYIYINKVSIATFLILFAINLIEMVVMYFVIENVVKMPWVYYALCGLVALLPLGIGVFKYGLTPNLKIRTRFNFASIFINSLIFLLASATIILSIAFLTATSLVEQADFLPKILVPMLFVLDAPIGALIYFILTKINVFYVNKRIVTE